MTSISDKVQIFWTKKVKLDKIIDPLYLSRLKFVENEFLKGITTQTERLRYYSFLTWAWYIIKNNNLPHSTILNMEKVFTLACVYHHLEKKDYPRGIRKRFSAEKFLEENEFIDVKNFTEFGRNNKQGYGNYYYTGSLAALRIFWIDNGEIKFSDIGERIARMYHKIARGQERFFIEGVFNKTELAKLQKHCVCQVREYEEELNIWCKIFFGFTKKEDFDPNTVIDERRFANFTVGEYRVNEDLDESNRLRRLTLFTIMKVINEAQPDGKEDILQSIRDGFYFGEVKRGNEIREVDYSGMSDIKKSLEVYVHNLYFIDILEYILAYILKILQTKPQGATIKEIIDSLDIHEIKKYIKEIFSEKGLEINEVTPENVMHHIENLKISLRESINERVIFFRFQEF